MTINIGRLSEAAFEKFAFNYKLMLRIYCKLCNYESGTDLSVTVDRWCSAGRLDVEQDVRFGLVVQFGRRPQYSCVGVDFEEAVGVAGINRVPYVSSIT